MANPNDLITSFENIGVPQSSNSSSPSQGSGKPKRDTQFWVNVGLLRGRPGEQKLVGLPMGIPLDELQEKKVPSTKTQNQEFRNLRLAERELWHKMRELMATLKPGESRVLPFQVEIRRVDEKEQIEDEQDPSVNPFAVGAVTF